MSQFYDLIRMQQTICEGLRSLGTEGVVDHVLGAVGRQMGVPCVYVFAPYLYGQPDRPITTSNSLILHNAGKMEYQSGMPAQFFQQYASHVWQIDPWREALETKMNRLMTLGGVIGHQHIPHAAMHRTDFYQDYLKPEIGLDSMMCATLEEGYWLGFMRSTTVGDFHEEDLNYVNQFKNQLAAFVTAHHQVMKLQTEQAQTRHVFEQLADGVVIVNGDGEIRMVNAAASRYLGVPKREFSDMAGRSHLLLPQIHRALWALVQKARDASFAQAYIASPAYAKGLQASVSWQKHSGVPQKDFAYIELIGANKLDIRVQVRKCADIYGLTATEANVLACLADMPPHEIAKELGLKVTTVRSHLASLFAKTNTRRQPELVWLLASS